MRLLVIFSFLLLSSSFSSAEEKYTTQYQEIDTGETNCNWLADKPRKLLSGPNCEQKICTGFVICEKNGRKRKRLASCSSQFCSSDTSTLCAREKNFGSIRLDFENTPTTTNNNNSGNNQQKSNQ